MRAIVFYIEVLGQEIRRLSRNGKISILLAQNFFVILSMV